MSNEDQTADPGTERHPPGLYVLFASEMWERFSFYSMLSLFTLYLRDTSGQGFGWSAEDATRLYANYMMFVYASPLVGGWLADNKLGYRKAAMIGGVFFMAGHLLLSFKSIVAVYAALTCLVVGNGLFKPNISTMVGLLYPAGSPLRDRAYNIFYMGINIGAFLAPVMMELIKQTIGYHPAFAAAAFGMVISVGILWHFQSLIEDPGPRASTAMEDRAKGSELDLVPEWKRIGALIVVYGIVIVFWMVFHQNGSTLTYWADENTDWNVSGTISGAINPFWVVTLTFPLVALWGRLNRVGMEPSTPVKIFFGMILTSLSFLVLFFAARSGERTHAVPEITAPTKDHPKYTVCRVELDAVQLEEFQKIVTRTATEAGASGVSPRELILKSRASVTDPEVKKALTNHAYQYRVSPAWLIGAYAVVTLGELMLSPMGLSLVSKVAPARVRGMMMGGWFVATAIGNKLTAIGVYWQEWHHSQFFAFLGLCALGTAFVLFFLLKPLKRAMPGV